MYLTPAERRPGIGALGRGVCIALVGASALLAAMASTAPTGFDGPDVGWRVVLAAAVTVGGLTAGPVARIAPALVGAAVAAGTGSWTLAAVACVVLLLSAVAPHQGRWGPVANAAVVGAGVQVLFRMPALVPDRTTTVLGVTAALVVLGAGWRGADDRARRVARWVVGATAGVLLVAAGPFLVAGALAWGDVGRGAGEANAWRVTTAEGDDERAAAHLQEATAAFHQAERRLDGWWSTSARLVPGVAQHVEAADVGLDAGLRLVGSAQEILDVADPASLQLADGALDLALVEAVRAPLGAGLAVLDDVASELDSVDDRWLLPFISNDLREVNVQVEDARRDAAFADRVLEVVPGMLGADAPRRYFVVFSNPAEARELGGILGNWGILTAVDGRLRLEETGRAGDLNVASAAAAARLTDPGAFPVRYVQAQPEEFWQNVTSHPDLPTVADAIADLHQQAVGGTIDGVVVIDPTGLAALLELTGPIELEGRDAPLTAETAIDFLLRDQYLEFPELGERVDFLAGAATATFDGLTSGALPGPAALAEVLGPVVAARHVQLWTFAPEPQPLLHELGLSGVLPSLDGDVLAVARSNAGPNKLDAYLTEALSYRVEVDPAAGLVRAELELTYTNEAPPGLPDYVAGNIHGLPPGTNRTLVSVWTPHLVTAATLDGRPLGVERQIELDRNRYLAVIEVPPGASATITLTLEGPLAADGYRLLVVPQPLGQPSAIDVTIASAPGQRLSDAPNMTVMGR